MPFQWLLAPQQTRPTDKPGWEASRLTGQEALAERAGKKLRSQEQLHLRLAGTMLRRELDTVPLWRGNHVLVSQSVDDFAQYLYLPRLGRPTVLYAAIQDALTLMLWREEGFAYADSYDEARGKYLGLRGGNRADGVDQGQGLLIRPEIAKPILDAAVAPSPPPTGMPGAVNDGDVGVWVGTDVPPPGGTQSGLRRFYGTVPLDAARVGRDAGRIADEVIAHLSALFGSKVTVTLEITADLEDHVSDSLVRTVTENARTLKFTSQGFERE